MASFQHTSQWGIGCCLPKAAIIGILLAPFLLQVTTPGYGQGNAVLGTTQIHPGGHYGVYNTTTFVSGYFVTPRNLPDHNVVFTAGSSHTGASNSSHVNGYVEKIGTTAFVFPTGNGTKLRTVSISAPASGSFRAAYWSVNPGLATLPPGAPFPTSNMGANIAAVSDKEYWDVDGASSVALTLTWDAASKADSLALHVASNLVVVGYNPATSKWENLGNEGGVTGTLTGTGSVTANNVVPNTYSAFTIGAIADQTDTDEDGIPDITDPDDDNDGLLDTQDPKPKDTDNDGIDNATDTDDDGDGIPDDQEAAGQKLDTDNDGIPNATDTDDDGDGIPDSTEQGVLGSDGKYTLPDTDGDGLPDLADAEDRINLTPVMLMPSPDFTNATPTKNFEIKVYNLGEAASTGTVTLYVIKPTPNFTMTFTASGWAVTDSGNFYTLTNNSVSVPAQMGTPPMISGSVTKGAGVAKGIYNLQVVIADNSGGEKNNTDNTANVTLNVNP